VTLLGPLSLPWVLGHQKRYLVVLWASYGIDIWSFGCLVFELLKGVPLFQLSPIGDSKESVDDDHLIQFTDVIAPLPESLFVEWSRAARYYGPNGERLDARPWDTEESGSYCMDTANSDAGDEEE
jgi:serine/threonine protein kinase